MAKRQFDKCVIMGRFEPIHLGHIQLLREAEKIADEVFVLSGSRNRARSIKNPWRIEDRKIMMTLAIEEMVPELSGRIKIVGIADYSYNDQHWASEVGMQVARLMYSGETRAGAFHASPHICLIGHKKDASSFYLDMFPQWKFIDVEPVKLLNATDIRQAYFGIHHGFNFEKAFKENLPLSVMNYLLDWRNTDHYKRLVEEYNGVLEDKKKYASYPYQDSLNHVTTDAVVVESGHVLMIKRGGKVGNGLWALPGGFLNNNERIIDGAVRELKEETDIDCPAKIIYGSCRGNHVFDALDRDPRGRIITHGFLFELPSKAGGLSKVKGCDDAAHAQWIPLYELDAMSENGEIFSDHADIIFHLTGRV